MTQVSIVSQGQVAPPVVHRIQYKLKATFELICKVRRRQMVRDGEAESRFMADFKILQMHDKEIFERIIFRLPLSANLLDSTRGF